MHESERFFSFFLFFLSGGLRNSPLSWAPEAKEANQRAPTSAQLAGYRGGVA